MKSIHTIIFITFYICKRSFIGANTQKPPIIRRFCRTYSVYIEASDEGYLTFLQLVIYSLLFQLTLDLLILFRLMKCFSKRQYALLLWKTLFRNVRGKQLAVNVFPSAIMTACSIVCFNSRTFPGHW